jgi:hypothetical protein
MPSDETAAVREAIALALFRDDRAYFTMYDDAESLAEHQAKWDSVWEDVLGYREQGKPHASGYFAKADAVLNTLGLEPFTRDGLPLMVGKAHGSTTYYNADPEHYEVAWRMVPPLPARSQDGGS